MAAVFEPVTADLRVRLLHPAATPPRRAHEHDAGYDLACVEGFTLWPARRRTVGTGVAIALPPGVAGVRPPPAGVPPPPPGPIVQPPRPAAPRLLGEVGVGALQNRHAPARPAGRGPPP